MKKIIKNNIFGFILGAVIFGTITGVFAYTLASKDVLYDNSTSGSEKTNVQDALDELYEKIGNMEVVHSEVLTYLNNQPVTKKANFLITSLQTTVNGEYSYPIVNGVAQNEKLAQMFRNEGQISNCVTLLKVDINPGDVITWGGVTNKFGQAIGLYIE